MATHFLADLHLDDAHDAFARRLQGYLAGDARFADALYVLGDLFEVWIGDDGSLARHRATVDAFANLTQAGVPVYFMRGNRDFAVGAAFVRATGMQILDDAHVIDLYGSPTLLCHGDLLCTDDRAHQAFRARYLDSDWRNRQLRLPLWSRRLLARWARTRSRRGKARKPRCIMDVNADAVAGVARQYGVRQLIHGHTHRPDTHVCDVDGTPVRRIVLPDWRPDRMGVLVADDTGFETLWLR